MRKKGITLIFLVIVLITAVGVGVGYMDKIKLEWYKKVEVSEYGLDISYPQAYEDILKEESNVDEISTNVKITEENVVTVQDKIPDLVKELIHAKSDLSGLELLIEGIKIEKTTKSIEDICKDYITMFKVYNPEETVVESKYEEILVDGIPAGRVEVYVKGKSEKVYPGIVAFLISLEDRELTITFTGTKKLIELSEGEINKIISSIKIN